MSSVASELRTALAVAVAGFPERDLAAATAELVARYRQPRAAQAAILSSEVRVAAYAAYRMPATQAAVQRVLDELAGHGFEPRTMLDLGGGTGAAAWAAAGSFATLESIRVVDQVPQALQLGRRLVAEASSSALRAASFERAVVGALPTAGADLVIASYVLSELSAAQTASLLEDMTARGRVAVVVEPGTPDGYERILGARSHFLARGWHLLGPCPHASTCPLVGRDWCHFAARVNRSAEHRRIKGGDLSYEDEKFSWVAAAAPDVVEQGVHTGDGRILRRPVKRKGLVEFQVCRPDGTAGRSVVSKREGERYRAARDREWGDTVPG
ncbi:small ribosomal subunit Rsm22 family protein [Intrasporangium calvum]|uniref:Small ribosomal subunit Rsm22 family protein n=1 Tax=Intrasporangium calvum TaxID=53358 RepID=A0ABT5GLZ8_9MICO|nr:small ribosomal subunit Rsm22 family protein [Intrasporangium calvum]MDC5699099.1 small ribosomal subunit Rsm22 family protein [Intrasporangium calvum]